MNEWMNNYNADNDNNYVYLYRTTWSAKKQ